MSVTRHVEMFKTYAIEHRAVKCQGCARKHTAGLSRCLHHSHVDVQISAVQHTMHVQPADVLKSSAYVLCASLACAHPCIQSEMPRR
jgi:hypothetical protein